MQYVTRQEYADLYGISLSTVKRLIASGEITEVKKSQRVRRIPVDTPVYKSHGGTVKHDPNRPACLHGCGKGDAGDHFCGRCGAAFPGVTIPATKSYSFQLPDDVYAESDPARREILVTMITKGR